jgi:RNA polymerase sigma-70 factor (ECF subfamily)
LGRPQLHGRLLRWPQEQFIAAGHDDLAACRIVVDRTADVYTMVATNDDDSRMFARPRGKAGWQVSDTSDPAGLTSRTREQPALLVGDILPADEDWISRLSAPGRVYEEAVAQLHELMLRAAGRQVSRMREATVLGAARREEIIHSAADEATMSVLSRLSTFEGRSAFTTWAYKFGILYAATEVRRAAWRDREINLDDVPEQHQTVAPSPEAYAEGRDLAQAIREGLREALTPHQRRIAVAVLIDEVPIDVLAERLGINRNALYKTLHDARQRLRAHLSAHDFLLPVASRKGVTR